MSFTSKALGRPRAASAGGKRTSSAMGRNTPKGGSPTAKALGHSRPAKQGSKGGGTSPLNPQVGRATYRYAKRNTSGVPIGR